jgi:hypothetical protein
VSASPWRRVTRRERCPVCGRFDWCLISADSTVALCQRVESSRRCGEAGFFHRLADAPAAPRCHVRRVHQTAAGPDLGPLAAEYRVALDAGRLHQLASQLGLSASSLTAVGVGWSAGHHAYTFPMHDCDGQTVGIRLRTPAGRKLSVKGGKEGLFLPPAPASPTGGRTRRRRATGGSRCLLRCYIARLLALPQTAPSTPYCGTWPRGLTVPACGRGQRGCSTARPPRAESACRCAASVLW